MGQGLMGEWDCSACGAKRIWPARFHCFRCGTLQITRRSLMVSMPRTKMATMFVAHGMDLEALSAIKTQAVPLRALPKLNPSPTRKARKKASREDHGPGTDPMQLLQNLPLD